MTTAEKTLKWWNDYKKMNGTYPLIAEIEAQLQMAVDEEKLVKNCSIPNVSDFSFEEIVDAVDYGFKYRNESQHSGHVPIGNSLQWLMAKRKMLSLPEQWKRYIEAKRNDR